MISPRRIARSRNPLVRALLRARRALLSFTLPAPRPVVLPARWLVVGLGSLINFLRRILYAEPLFKAACARVGRGVRTDIYLHYITGKGDIILGENVLVDGKCSFGFAARYVDRPALVIGDHSGIGHGCSFTVANRITIGRFCRIASEAIFFDSSGHPSEPQARMQGLPAPDSEVRPIVVQDNVWIGRRAIVFPGVTIGEGSIIAAGAVVTGDVPPYTVAAGNPARRIAGLTPPPTSPDSDPAHQTVGRHQSSDRELPSCPNEAERSKRDTADERPSPSPAGKE